MDLLPQLGHMGDLPTVMSRGCLNGINQLGMAMVRIGTYGMWPE